MHVRIGSTEHAFDVNGFCQLHDQECSWTDPDMIDPDLAV